MGNGWASLQVLKTNPIFRELSFIPLPTLQCAVGLEFGFAGVDRPLSRIWETQAVVAIHCPRDNVPNFFKVHIC